MLSLPALGASLLAFSASTLAASIPDVSKRDSVCTNGPSSRNCWQNGFSVDTNSYDKFPDTGVTRTVSTRDRSWHAIPN
jgi:hypothetical protein